MAGELEQTADRVSVGGGPAPRRGYRACGVGGDELDVDPLGDLIRSGRRAETIALGGELRGGPPIPAVGEEEVEETGPGDLDALHRPDELLAQLLGELLGCAARLFTERRRDQHRRVGGVVAELRLGRPLECWFG